MEPDHWAGTPPVYWPGHHNGGYESRLFTLNDLGEALGASAPEVHYYYWRAGVAHWLVNPFADGRAWAINNRSEVAGTTKDGALHVWTVGGGVARVVTPGYVPVEISAIDDRGRILARVRGPSGEIAALLQP